MFFCRSFNWRHGFGRNDDSLGHKKAAQVQFTQGLWANNILFCSSIISEGDVAQKTYIGLNTILLRSQNACAVEFSYP